MKILKVNKPESDADPGELSSNGLALVRFDEQLYVVETGKLYDGTFEAVELPDGRVIEPIEPWLEMYPPRPTGWLLVQNPT